MQLVNIGYGNMISAERIESRCRTRQEIGAEYP